MVAEMLELTGLDGFSRRLEHHLFLAREVATGDVEQRAHLLAQDLDVLQTEERPDLLIHELVLVAGPPEDPGEAEGWAAALASRWAAATL